MSCLPHLAARLFGVPLAIHRPKLDVILSVLGPRLDYSPQPGGPVLSAYTPPPRAEAPQHPAVAIIPIHGTLVRRTVGLEAESGLTSYAGLSAQLDAAIANHDIAAILLDVDSPGGESSGVFDLADRIRAATKIKPVWAVANDMAFSAAYALASAADKVFVSRTGGVGSIGVIAMHVDQSQKDAQDGVRYTAVFAGDRKNDLNPHAPISSEAHAFLSAEVHRIYSLFVDTVAKNRGLESAAVRHTEAALFFGSSAVSMGLADAIGTLDDALSQLTRMLSTTSRTSNPGASSTTKAQTTKGADSFGASPSSLTDCHQPASNEGPSHNPRPMEPLMNEPSDPNESGQLQGIAANGDVAASDPRPVLPQAAGKEGVAVFGVDDALEIAQTCTLAGRTELIAGFLEAKTPPAQVRQQLLNAQADASPEISSRIHPHAQASAAPVSHALIDAAKQLASRITSKDL